MKKKNEESRKRGKPGRASWERQLVLRSLSEVGRFTGEFAPAPLLHSAFFLLPSPFFGANWRLLEAFGVDFFKNPLRCPAETPGIRFAARDIDNF